MAKKYDRLSDLLQDTQGDKSLSWLKDNAPHVQLELIKACVRTALKLELPANADIDKALALIVLRSHNDAKYTKEQAKPDKQLAMAFNDFAREHAIDLRIIANGYKGLDRLLTKQLQKNAKPNAVSDLIRVTICSRQSPDIVERFRDEFKKTYDHFDDGIGVKPSGMMSSDFRIAFKGIVSQIEVAEKDLMIRAGGISHALYEIRRDIDGISKSLKPLDGSDKTQSILRRYQGWKALTDDMLHDDYDARLARYVDLGKYIHHVAPMLTDKEATRISNCFNDDIHRLSYFGRFLRLACEKKLFHGLDTVAEGAGSDPSTISLNTIGKELLGLSQLVHVAYIRNAEAPWRTKYVEEVSAMNRAAGREVLPKGLLDLVGPSPTLPPQGRSHA